METNELKILAYNMAGQFEKDFIGEVFSITDNFKELKIIELGTGYGSFLMPLAVACKEKNGKVFTIDKHIQKEIGYDTVKERIKGFELDNFVDFIVGDDLEESILERFENNNFDIIMIDTSHTYLHTLMELICYSEKLKNDGYFILHDTGTHTRLHCCENPCLHENYGVRRAVETFIKHFDYLIIKDIDIGAGLMILKKW